MRVRSSSNNANKNPGFQTWNDGLGAAGAVSGSMLALPSDPEQIIQNGRNSINMANMASAPDVSKVYQNLPHQHVPVGDQVPQSQVYVSKKSKSSKKHSGNGQGK